MQNSGLLVHCMTESLSLRARDRDTIESILILCQWVMVNDCMQDNFSHARSAYRLARNDRASCIQCK